MSLCERDTKYCTKNITESADDLLPSFSRFIWKIVSIDNWLVLVLFSVYMKTIVNLIAERHIRHSTYCMSHTIKSYKFIQVDFFS